jgi:hypothetical protein
MTPNPTPSVIPSAAEALAEECKRLAIEYADASHEHGADSGCDDPELFAVTQEAKVALNAAIDRLASLAASAASLVAEPDWHKGCVTLTAKQLATALDFAAPDYATDEDQRETQVSIAWGPEGSTTSDEGDPDPAGYKVWMTDYPGEGSIPLDDMIAGVSDMAGAKSITLAAPQFPAASVERATAVVTWRNHVEQRMHSWRQRFVNKSGDQLALDDFMDAESLNDLIDYVLDEWAGLSPQEPAVQPTGGDANG